MQTVLRTSPCGKTVCQLCTKQLSSPPTLTIIWTCLLARNPFGSQIHLKLHIISNSFRLVFVKKCQPYQKHKSICVHCCNRIRSELLNHTDNISQYRPLHSVWSPGCEYSKTLKGLCIKSQ